MRKLSGIFFLTLWANVGWAQNDHTEEHSSSTGFIIIGVILLIIVIIMLYNRQKRKFND